VLPPLLRVCYCKNNPEKKDHVSSQHAGKIVSAVSTQARSCQQSALRQDHVNSQANTCPCDRRRGFSRQWRSQDFSMGRRLAGSGVSPPQALGDFCNSSIKIRHFYANFGQNSYFKAIIDQIKGFKISPNVQNTINEIQVL